MGSCLALVLEGQVCMAFSLSAHYSHVCFLPSPPAPQSSLPLTCSVPLLRCKFLSLYTYIPICVYFCNFVLHFSNYRTCVCFCFVFVLLFFFCCLFVIISVAILFFVFFPHFFFLLIVNRCFLFTNEKHTCIGK